MSGRGLQRIGRRRARAARAVGVVDDRARIGLAELDAGRGQHVRRRLPRVMQIRRPAAPRVRARTRAHRRRRGSNFSPWQDRVEDAEIGRGVGARAGDPLPARRVVGRVGIDQRVPEPGLAVAPVDQQMLDQERRRRSCARGCASSRCARAGACRHRRSDSRSAPRCQAVKRLGRRGARERRRSAAGSWFGRGRPTLAQQVVGEFAPAELASGIFDVACRCIAGRLGMPGRVPDLDGRDLAEMQMRREARRRRRVGPVAVLAIAARPPVEKVRAARRRAPSLPGVQAAAMSAAQSGLVRQQRQVGQRVAREHAASGMRAPCGAPHRPARLAGGLRRLPERREDPHRRRPTWIARAWLEQKIAVERLDCDGLGSASAASTSASPGARPARNAGSRRRGRPSPRAPPPAGRSGRAAPQNEPAADASQTLVERVESVVQPPAARRAAGCAAPARGPPER